MSRGFVRAAIVAGALALAAPAFAAGRCGNHPWCDTSLSPDARAGLLLKELTQDEKISLMGGDDAFGVAGGEHSHTGTSDGVERVDLPTTYYSDGPVGPRQGKTTAMPIPMALAATFDPRYAYMYGKVVGNEVKSKGNDVVFAPTVNIMRTPLNGRTFEGYGEDTYLVGRLAVQWVNGAQSEGVIGDIKHFAANNQEGQSPAADQGGPGQPLGPPAGEGNRLFVNSVVDERTLREIYLPQFEAAVKEAHVGSVMCSYNRLNGQYACENEHLLNQILKHEWGFKGYVLADYGAAHPNGTVTSLNNGLDFEPWPGMAYNPNEIQLALATQQASPDLINEHIRRVLRTAFEFGFFDRPAFKDDDAQIDKAAHAKIAQEVEEQAITLLKNDGVLPLDAAKLKSIAVIGSDAAKFKTGGGSGAVTPFSFNTPLDAITKRAGSGVKVAFNDGSDAQSAADLAKSSDIAIVFAGDYQSEGADRRCLSLECPQYNGDQDGLINSVADAQPNTIVVLETGGPDLTPWRDKLQALVEAWYPGQEGGPAIARVLFGDTDPGGRLPATFPQSEDQLPTAGDPEKYPGDGETVTYKEGVLVGYRWYDANNLTPAFPFGFGLSYTTFDFKGLKVASDVGGTLPLTVTADVKNTGSRAGFAVPQLYLGLPQPAPGVVQPPKQLRGMEKVSLKPGETKRVKFTVGERGLSYWDVNQDGWKIAPGCYQVMLGSSSRDIAGKAVVSMDGASCDGGVLGVKTLGVCKRSVLVHLRHVKGRIRSVVATASGRRTTFKFKGNRDAVRVTIGGAAKITTVRLVIKTTRGTVRMKRRFHTCVPKHPGSPQ
jgi:beta-glucosidase